jgi:Protein of unknown function (DUF2794)
MSANQETRPIAAVLRLSDYRRRQKTIFFSRPELNRLLSLYSRQVARGEWRDYAIDQRDGAALFSVFRHTQEAALYTVVKKASDGGKHVNFTLLRGRQVLATGPGLGEVLKKLQPAVLLDGVFGSHSTPKG